MFVHFRETPYGLAMSGRSFLAQTHRDPKPPARRLFLVEALKEQYR
jgi:hypothetical protein